MSIVFIPSAGVSSDGIDEDEFGILLGGDGEFGLVDGSDAVPRRNPLPVDDDQALGGGEITVRISSRRVREGGSGEQRCAHDARIGAYQQRLGILRIPARQFDQASGAIRFGDFATVPARSPTAMARTQPDLEELEGVFVAIVLGMSDARSGTYDLDIAGYDPTDVAYAIFVRDGALADVSDDFHVDMGVTAKAGAGRDLVVVPDHEGAECTVRGISVGRNDEVVARLQPSAIAVIDFAAAALKSAAVS